MGIATKAAFSDQALDVAARFDACMAAFKAATWTLQKVDRLVALCLALESLQTSGRGLIALQGDDWVERLYPSDDFLSLIEALERLAAECLPRTGSGVTPAPDVAT